MRNFNYQLSHLFEAMKSSGATTTALVNYVKELALLEDANSKSPPTRPDFLLYHYDIDRFGEILALVVDHDQTLDGIPSENRMEVRSCYSDIRYERDTLTWSVCSRKPGSVSQGPINDNGTREYGARLRQSYEDPINPGAFIAEYGKRMDNVLELTVTSTDEATANRLALKVEDLLDENMWVFSLHGFNRLTFFERVKDEHMEVGGNPVYKRCLKYYVRTEKVTKRREFALRKLLLELRIVPPGTQI